jgi:hypothetical protein
VGDPGAFSWVLSFQNGHFGVFASTAGKCRTGLVKLTGRCRPSKIAFGKGQQTVASPGTVTFTVKPSASALKALRKALTKRKALTVTATLTFQSSNGGKPVSHTQSVTVRLRKKGK